MKAALICRNFGEKQCRSMIYDADSSVCMIYDTDHIRTFMEFSGHISNLIYLERIDRVSDYVIMKWQSGT